MDVCDLLEDILTAVVPFTGRKSIICKGLVFSFVFFLFDFLMRYSHCKVHHVSLSSRLNISVRSKSERPYQDWEAHRIRYCVYLIPICLYPSSHGNAKFVHEAVIKGFSRSWCPPAPSFIQPMAPSAPRLLSAPCPHPLGVSADIWVSSPSHS